MSRWYRAYEGTCTDPKLAEAALVAGCSRSVTIAAWHLILEDSARVNDAGRFEIPTRRIAAALCEPLDLMEAVFDAFTSIGLIADAHVAAWKRRQYESDNSAERVRKCRKTKQAAKCNGGETLQPPLVTPPDTETDIPLPNGNGRAAVDLCKGVFDSGVALLTADGEPERNARSFLGRLRQQHGDPAVIDALARCEVTRPSDPKAWLSVNCRGTPNATRQTISNRNAADLARQKLAGYG